VFRSRYHHKQHTRQEERSFGDLVSPKISTVPPFQPFPYLLLLVQLRLQVQLGNYGEDLLLFPRSAPWIFYIITSLGVKGSLPPFKQFKTQRICIRYYTIQIRYTQQQQIHTIPYQDVISRDVQPSPPSSSYTTPPPPPPS
jgi:hypothetical protein